MSTVYSVSMKDFPEACSLFKLFTMTNSVLHFFSYQLWRQIVRQVFIPRSLLIRSGYWMIHKYLYIHTILSLQILIVTVSGSTYSLNWVWKNRLITSVILMWWYTDQRTQWKEYETMLVWRILFAEQISFAHSVQVCRSPVSSPRLVADLPRNVIIVPD